MRRNIVYNFIGKVLIGFGLLLIFPILVAFIYKENMAPFFTPQVISFTIGIMLTRIDTKNEIMYAKDGFKIVSLSWIIISLIGALPIYLNKDASFIDSLFETVSGFTTTGATIFEDVEVLNKSILFWRSFSHFIGGMGVLAFVMTIIPLARNDKSMHVLRAEMPGPTVGKLVPSIRKTLIYLYGIYIGLTATEFILLKIGGLSYFDSLIISIGTAGTGGFSVLNTSLMTYSVFSKCVVTVFMLLFGINFNLFFLIIKGDIKTALKSEELRVYIALYITSVLFIFINNLKSFTSVFQAGLESAFHVGSIITSTGYSIGDINIYTTQSRILILMLMLISACAGSTCGGFKISRLIIMFKSIKRNLKKIIHPNNVEIITFEGKKVSEETIRSTNNFMLLYSIIIIAIIFIVGHDGLSFETTVNATFTTFGNVGLCFNISNFSAFSNLSKIVLTIGMLLGRLEIYPIIVLLTDIHLEKKRKIE